MDIQQCPESPLAATGPSPASPPCPLSPRSVADKNGGTKAWPFTVLNPQLPHKLVVPTTPCRGIEDKVDRSLPWGIFCGGEALWDYAYGRLATPADRASHGMAINPSARRTRHQASGGGGGGGSGGAWGSAHVLPLSTGCRLSVYSTPR